MRASSPRSVGVSLIGLAIILSLYTLNINNVKCNVNRTVFPDIRVRDSDPLGRRRAGSFVLMFSGARLRFRRRVTSEVKVVAPKI